jgi:hypothetical protein
MVNYTYESDTHCIQQLLTPRYLLCFAFLRVARLSLSCCLTCSPPQIMRKGVLNDLERQTRAIERKTREVEEANMWGGS